MDAHHEAEHLRKTAQAQAQTQVQKAAAVAQAQAAAAAAADTKRKVEEGDRGDSYGDDAYEDDT